MSSAQSLREFVTERLTAAAEEIFRVFEQTIVEYEAEIDRQRRLLDVVWNPQIKLHRIELPQHRVCKVEVPTNQQLCNQERNPSLDHEDPGPPHLKEEQEELCTSQEGEQLVVKQETDHVMLVPAYGERCQDEPEPISQQQLVSHSQDQEESQQGNSGSPSRAEPKPEMSCHSNAVSEADVHSNTLVGKKPLQCDFCGKHFKSRFGLTEHVRIHTGEKPHVCKVCGRRFSRLSALNIHLRIHPGDHLHLCNICGESFSVWLNLKRHMLSHTAERPYVCSTCGDRFYQLSHLKNHIKIHSRENVFVCRLRGAPADDIIGTPGGNDTDVCIPAQTGE